MHKDFVALAPFTPQELRDLLDLARQVKLTPGAVKGACKGQTLAMIFQKPSLRTRVSFETAMYELGGQAIYLGPTDIQTHRGESLADTARVLSRYASAIMARVFAHQDILDLAAHATVPVINGLSDLLHPCQVVADLMTLRERFESLRGRKLAYVGDGNNMANSLLEGCALTGMSVAVAHPHGYAPDPDITTKAHELAASTGGAVLVTEDPAEAVEDADAVYTDAWASMGQEAEHTERAARFAGYTVDERLMGRARPHAVFLHCLPAHRGEEVAPEVIDGPQSIVFDQAENRLHVQKAILVTLLGR
jgi:ornithine carbamoyltransferase